MSSSSRKHRHKRDRDYGEYYVDPSQAQALAGTQSFYDYDLNPYDLQASGNGLPQVATSNYGRPIHSTYQEVAPLSSDPEPPVAFAQWKQSPPTTYDYGGWTNNIITNEEVLGGGSWGGQLTHENDINHLRGEDGGEDSEDSFSASNDEGESGSESDVEVDSADPEDANIPETLDSTDGDVEGKGKGKGKNVSFGTAQQAYVQTHYTHRSTSKSKSQLSLSDLIVGKKKGKQKGPRHAKPRWGEDRLDIEKKPMTAYQPASYGTTSGDICTDIGATSTLSPTAVQPAEEYKSAGAPDITSFAATTPTTTASGGNRSRIISYCPSEGLMKRIRKTGTLTKDSIGALEHWSTSVSKAQDTLDFSNWMQEAGFGWPTGGSYNSSSSKGGLSKNVKFTALLDGVSGVRDLESDLRQELTKESWNRYEKYYNKHIGKKR